MKAALRTTFFIIVFLTSVSVIFSCFNPLLYYIYIFGVDKNYSIEDKEWLDARINEWRPHTYSPLKFGVDTQIFIGMGELPTADKNLSSYAFSEKLLPVFLELDLDTLRVGAVDDAWRSGNTEDIALSDQLMKQVKTSGKELFLADTQHSPYLLNHPVSWEEFQSLHLKRIAFFTERYNPDYYCVVVEPSVYHSHGVGGEMDPEKWVKQTEAAVNVVKRINRNIQTAVSVGPEAENDRIYIQKVFAVKNLDIIGLEAYYPRDVEELEKLLNNIPDRQGKKLWITETWSGMPFPYTQVEGKDREDAKWVKAMTYFAQKYKFDGLLVWPFQYFVTYERFDNTEEPVDFSKRTASFFAYRDLIKKVRAKSSEKKKRD
jgi:hypothetical protein